MSQSNYENCEQFEKEFAEYFGSNHAVMVNSGSTANLLMIALLKWRHNLTRFEGANIIVPVIGWSTTYFPLTHNGFRVNFVDVDPETYNIDVNKIEQAINPSTVAIMPVNLVGNPANYTEIKAICAKHKLLLLEDNCEALGAKWDDRHTGTLGFAGSHSFFFSHHMQTMEGGMICTPNEGDVHWLKSLRAHGWCRDLPDDFELYTKTGDFFKDSFTFVAPGYNVRPLEMSGAIGSVQLKKWPKLLQGRLENLKYFRELFDDVPWLRLQQDKHGESSWFAFGCVLQESLLGRRDEVTKAFDEHGIEYRPIASGKISIRLALFYACCLCLIALMVLIKFNTFTIIIALGSMPLAFTYPLMKRYTYWPQLFLGITFNYGLILGWTSINQEINLTAIILYFGAIFWTLGYDTIYGYQDIQDDEIIGLKSTSIKFKNNAKKFLVTCYTIFFVSLIIVGVYMGFKNFYYLALILPLIHLIFFQIKKFKSSDSEICLKIFKSNNFFGLIVFATIIFGKIV